MYITIVCTLTYKIHINIVFERLIKPYKYSSILEQEMIVGI
jgi:hypothetical protein